MERGFEEEEKQRPQSREEVGDVGLLQTTVSHPGWQDPGEIKQEMLDMASYRRVLCAKVGCLCLIRDVWRSALKL